VFASSAERVHTIWCRPSAPTRFDDRNAMTCEPDYSQPGQIYQEVMIDPLESTKSVVLTD
jgi:hypothetical protein